jgi:hypothetical protein
MEIYCLLAQWSPAPAVPHHRSPTSTIQAQDTLPGRLTILVHPALHHRPPPLRRHHRYLNRSVLLSQAPPGSWAPSFPFLSFSLDNHAHKLNRRTITWASLGETLPLSNSGGSSIRRYCGSLVLRSCAVPSPPSRFSRRIATARNIRRRRVTRIAVPFHVQATK